jgi:hypothetical protein
MKQAWWILAFWLISHQAWSSVTLLELVDYRLDQNLILDARTQIELPDDVIKALEHEIPIHLITQLELIRHDQFFVFPFTTRQVTHQYTTVLSYSRFDRHYQLHNLRNDNRSNFRTLESALDTFGSLIGFRVANLSELYPGVRYHIRLRFRLDPWALPAPLYTETLLNRQWHFKSAWFSLPIQTGRRK